MHRNPWQEALPVEAKQEASLAGNSEYRALVIPYSRFSFRLGCVWPSFRGLGKARIGTLCVGGAEKHSRLRGSHRRRGDRESWPRCCHVISANCWKGWMWTNLRLSTFRG